MRLIFKKIGIENFLSFGSYCEVSLNDRGYTLIEGRNENPEDNAQSNGSGKTSLIDAIVYALTGSTTRGINKNLANIHTDGGMLVKLEFDVDGNEYAILRARDHITYGTTIMFTVNGEDRSGKGIRDTEKIIKDYLPELTESLITSVIVLGQGMPNRFTNNTPSGRKEVLENLSHSAFMIEDIKSRLSNKKNTLSDTVKDLQMHLSSVQGQKDVYALQLTQYQTALKKLTPVSPGEIMNLEAEISELNAQQSQEYSYQDQALSDQEVFSTQLNDLKNAREGEIVELDTGYSPLKQQIRDNSIMLNANIKTLNNEIIRLKAVKDVCPTCGQKLLNVHKIDTTEKEKNLESLQEEAAKFNKQQEEINDSYASAKSQIEAKYAPKEVELLNSLNSVKNYLSKARSSIQDRATIIKSKEDILNNLRQIHNTYQQTLDNLNANISAATKAIAQLDSQLLDINKNKEEQEQKLKIVDKMWTLASRDFRGYLLTNVINYLNRQAKIYCTDIFGTTKIDFQLDDNNLNVTYDDKLYENLSGGEQKRIDIICQFAIRDMLCQFSNFSSNILVLDEITDSLDAVSTSAVINCLTSRLKDVESTFIVTHATNFSMPYDSKITVVKDRDGISQIIN